MREFQENRALSLMVMAKVISYVKKSSLEGGHHPSRYGHESTRENAL